MTMSTRGTEPSGRASALLNLTGERASRKNQKTLGRAQPLEPSDLFNSIP